MTPRRRALLVVGLLAATVRLLYLTAHAGSPFFVFPVLDEVWYDAAARSLLDLPGGTPLDGFRPLLYPALLAVVYAVVGADVGPLAAVAAQHGLGVLTALVVTTTAARVYRNWGTATIAGALFALAGPPLYFEGELLIATVQAALLTGTLALLVRAEEVPTRTGLWIGAGVLLGLAVHARGNSLILFPLLLLYVWRSRRDRPEAMAGTLRSLAAAVITLVLGSTLAAAAGAPFQLVPGAGGVNLYLGNKRGADGMIPRQDAAAAYGDVYRDSVQLFSEAEYRKDAGSGAGAPVSPGAVSRYWIGRTAREIVAAPLEWIGLLARKAWFLVWNHEIPNNRSYTFAATEETPILGRLPVRWWWIFALAPLGWWRSRHSFWIPAVPIAYGLGVIAFFVNARYRIPLWPMLAIPAAGGLTALIETARSRKVRPILVSFGAVAALATLSLMRPPGALPDDVSRDLLYRSAARLATGDVDAAVEDAQRARELSPREAAIELQLGNALLEQGNAGAAAAAFERVEQLAPEQPRGANNLGVALERLERYGEAAAAYRRALAVQPAYSPPAVNLGLLMLRAGRLDRAEELFDRAAAGASDSVPLLVGRAVLERRRGRTAAAAQWLDAARRIDADLVDRLEEELGHPLDPAMLAGDGP